MKIEFIPNRDLIEDKIKGNFDLYGKKYKSKLQYNYLLNDIDKDNGKVQITVYNMSLSDFYLSGFRNTILPIPVIVFGQEIYFNAFYDIEAQITVLIEI